MIDNIKRYKPLDGTMISDPKGDYVLFTDHDNRVADLIDDSYVTYGINQSKVKLISSLEAENELLRAEIAQIRTITEIKGCICKRKFVKQIPSLILDPSLILKEKTHE